MKEEKLRLVGLTLGVNECEGENEEDYFNYDIGLIAHQALCALKIAVKAVEQSSTGERLMKSLDVFDFYASLNSALEEHNGEGILSDSGEVSEVQDEIQELIRLVEKAQLHALYGSGTSRSKETNENKGGNT